MFYNCNSCEIPGRMISKDIFLNSKSSLEKLLLRLTATLPRRKTGMVLIPILATRKLEGRMRS